MRRHPIKLLLGACLLSLTASASAADFSLDEVFSGLAKNGPSSSRFIEQKTIAEFEAPIESTGELVYQAPARLEKRTINPEAETMILDGDMLIVERGEFRREIPVADMPAVGAFVASLRSFVSGDLDSVKQAFDLTLTGNSQKWIIDGKPLDSGVKRIVESIQVIGSGEQFSVFSVLLTSGDSSTLTLIK